MVHDEIIYKAWMMKYFLVMEVRPLICSHDMATLKVNLYIAHSLNKNLIPNIYHLEYRVQQYFFFSSQLNNFVFKF